jgi:iron complex transport system substrate-binding protein
VIFVSPKEAATIGYRPGWEQIRAVKERRICSFASDVSDTIVRAGPRVAEGLRAMAECLNRLAP